MLRAVATALVVIAAGGAGACQGDPAPAATPPAAAVTWRDVGRWSGGLSRQTESFEVSTVPMRLRWQTTRETSPGAGRLIVTLHSAVSGRWLQTVVDARGVTSGTVEVADEPKLCHLVIEAAGVDWQMTLDQAFAAAPP